MSAIGPNQPPIDTAALVTVATQQITMAGSNVGMSTYFTSGVCRRVVPQVSGTIYLQRQQDGSTYTSYVATAGVPIDGLFIGIGASTTNPMLVNLEV